MRKLIWLVVSTLLVGLLGFGMLPDFQGKAGLISCDQDDFSLEHEISLPFLDELSALYPEQLEILLAIPAQPCEVEFQTVGRGSVKMKGKTPTFGEILKARDAAYTDALAKALLICMLNPKCPVAKFVRYAEFDWSHDGTNVTATLKVIFKCVAK